MSNRTLAGLERYLTRNQVAVLHFLALLLTYESLNVQELAALTQSRQTMVSKHITCLTRYGVLQRSVQGIPPSYRVFVDTKTFTIIDVLEKLWLQFDIPLEIGVKPISVLPEIFSGRNYD